ncbi:hypothetical protein 162322290 [Organic Lake phycodnavirus 1]|jgi:hypothetical protein|nr:hypothetical protein 162322290 [Organic Lake phycodnavirus 1]
MTEYDLVEKGATSEAVMQQGGYKRRKPSRKRMKRKSMNKSMKNKSMNLRKRRMARKMNKGKSKKNHRGGEMDRQIY